jgi:Fic family protein
MENTTMTNREFYTNIANGIITQNEIAHAEAAIAKLDATNEKRKANPAKNTKKAEENAPIKAAILEALTAEAKTAPEIGAIVGVSHNKVTPLVKQLVAEGLAEQTEIKVPGKGTMKGYALAPVDAE